LLLFCCHFTSFSFRYTTMRYGDAASWLMLIIAAAARAIFSLMVAADAAYALRYACIVTTAASCALKRSAACTGMRYTRMRGSRPRGSARWVRAPRSRC